MKAPAILVVGMALLPALSQSFQISKQQSPLQWPSVARKYLDAPTDSGLTDLDGVSLTTTTISSTESNEEQLRKAASSVYSSGRPVPNDLYGALSFAAAAVGADHVALLIQGIAGAEFAISKLDKMYNTLPQEVERFAVTLNSIRETLDCTLKECSLDPSFGENEVPPQVIELTQLIAEGEDFIRSLQSKEDFVTVLAKQLLLGNNDPVSKLSQLSIQIKEAESKLQLYKAVRQVRKQNEEQATDVQRQMQELQETIKEMKEAQREFVQSKTSEAQKINGLLRDDSPNTVFPLNLQKVRNAVRRVLPFRKNPRATTVQLKKLKTRNVLNELFDDEDDDLSVATAYYVQEIEHSAFPLRVETPTPANEEKRLRVLRDSRLVQFEMEGTPVGNGFEYHRTELIRTVLKLLQDTLPECSPFCLQVVGDEDSYTLNGEHIKTPITPRSQVPCQHVMCLATSDKSQINADGYTSDNVLAINLWDKHRELTKNFCYTPETLSYVGAAIQISDVTIGSLCMASNKTIEDLRWNRKKSAYVRKVATVLEDQLTRLCVDWKLYEGELPSDWGQMDMDKLLADAHFDD